MSANNKETAENAKKNFQAADKEFRKQNGDSVKFSQIAGCFGLRKVFKASDKLRSLTEAEVKGRLTGSNTNYCDQVADAFSGADDEVTLVWITNLLANVTMLPTCKTNEKDEIKSAKCKFFLGSKKPISGKLTNNGKGSMVGRLVAIKKIVSSNICEGIKRCVIARLIGNKPYKEFALNAKQKKEKKDKPENAADKAKKDKRTVDLKAKFENLVNKYNEAMEDIDEPYCGGFQRSVQITTNTATTNDLLGCIPKGKVDRYLDAPPADNEKKCFGFTSTNKEPNWDAKDGSDTKIFDLCANDGALKWEDVIKEKDTANFHNVTRKFHFYACKGTDCNTKANVVATCDDKNDADFKNFYVSHVYNCLIKAQFEIKQFLTCKPKGKDLDKISKCADKAKSGDCADKKRGWTCSPEIAKSIKTMVECIDSSIAANNQTPNRAIDRNRIGMIINTLFKKYCPISVKGKDISIQTIVAHIKVNFNKDISDMTADELVKAVKGLIVLYGLNADTTLFNFQKPNSEELDDDISEDTNSDNNLQPVTRRRRLTAGTTASLNLIGGNCPVTDATATSGSVTASGGTECTANQESVGSDTLINGGLADPTKSANDLINSGSSTSSAILPKIFSFVFLIFIILLL